MYPIVWVCYVNHWLQTGQDVWPVMWFLIFLGQTDPEDQKTDPWVTALINLCSGFWLNVCTCIQVLIELELYFVFVTDWYPIYHIRRGSLQLSGFTLYMYTNYNGPSSNSFNFKTGHHWHNSYIFCVLPFWVHFQFKTIFFWLKGDRSLKIQGSLYICIGFY